MRFSSLAILTPLFAPLLFMACSGGDGSNTATASGGGAAAGAGGRGGSGGGPIGATDGGADSTSDGGTGGAGDASLCNPSPANVEVAGNGCDDDGDGKVDDVAACDTALPSTGDAITFARALGLCQPADATHWGIVAADFTSGASAAPPNPNQHGILSAFGTAVRPREGGAFGVLSTGYAMAFDGPGQKLFVDGAAWHTGAAAGTLPAGYPAATPGCAIGAGAFDPASITLQIKVPANAHRISIDYDFYSSEWPRFVCSQFNDEFVALLDAPGAHPADAGADAGAAAAIDIARDPAGAVISVNAATFDRCTPGGWTNCPIPSTPGTVKAACAAGEAELARTGFGVKQPICTNSPTETSGGATGWRTASAPVKPGETITLQLLIWNTGDEQVDSSVLLDALRFTP